jgi:hypothetical protein
MTTERIDKLDVIRVYEDLRRLVGRRAGTNLDHEEGDWALSRTANGWIVRQYVPGSGWTLHPLNQVPLDTRSMLVALRMAIRAIAIRETPIGGGSK